MKAAQVRSLTGPEGVEIVDLPEPTPGEHVIVEVAAAGISFPDLMLSYGTYQLKPPPPFTLGVEACGIVRYAPQNSAFSQGDRVVAFGLGACAELMASPIVFALPEPLDFTQGAGLIMNYHTAHFGLVRRAGVQAGESVLVLGAAGGTGTAAVQVAKALGAHVIAAVSSDQKDAIARTAGADEVVRTGAGLSDAVLALTAGDGVNVIYDPVGGCDEQLRTNVRCLAAEGRLVVIGFAAGQIPSIGLNRLLFRNVSVLGAAWGAFAFGRPAYLQDVAADLDRMAREGFVRPVIGKQYTIDQVPEALHDIEQRRAVGKLVMVNG